MDLKFLIYSNSDLVSQYSENMENVKNHLKKYGEYEKRLYTEEHSNLYYNYDWDEYLETNSDIKNSGFNTKIDALKHYYYYGKKEGRKVLKLKLKKNNSAVDYIATNDFKLDYQTFINNPNHSKINNYDWDRYLEENSDLSKNGINNGNLALKHYLKFGYNEGRNIYYTKKFHDEVFVESKENISQLKKKILMKKDDKSLFYDLMDKYDWKKYIKSNKDLYEVISNDSDAVRHFIKHGINEGRNIFKFKQNDKNNSNNKNNNKNNDNRGVNNNNYKDDNNKINYNEFDKDESDYNILSLLDRKNSYSNANSLNFEKSDVNTSIILKDNVNNWKKYILENNDLRQHNITDESEAFKHYLLFGKSEGRKLYKYDNDFDGWENDLDEINEINYFYLYENYDWNKYLQNNDDLSDNKVFNKLDACIHYIVKGNHEDRFIYKIDKNIEDNKNLGFRDKDNDYINTDIENNDNIIGNDNNSDNDTKLNNIYNSNNSESEIYSDEKILKNIGSHNIELCDLFLIDDRKITFNCLLEFNHNYYLKMNRDLLDLTTEVDCVNHFLKYGEKEYRPYSKKHYYLYLNYDWNRYIKDYNLKDYNIFYERDAFHHYVKNVIYGSENYDIYLRFNKNTFNSDFYDKYYNLNNKDTLKNFNTFLLNSSEDKIRFNHSNYFIYKIIDWESFKKNNIRVLDENLNNNEIFEYFIKNLKSDKNFKLKFDLHYLSKSLIENIDKVFIELEDFTDIINKNIIRNDNNFLLDVLSINDFFSKYDDDYNILHIPDFYVFNNIVSKTNDLNFTFVIYSHNNEINLENNISSIVYQNYSKWSIIYYNDASSDETERSFWRLVKKYSIEDRVTYLVNKKKMGKLYCKYEMYKKSNLNDILIILDGNDWLNSNSSLTILCNKYVEQEDLVVYSGYMSYSNKKINKTFKNFRFNENIKKNLLYRTHYILDNYYNVSAYANLFKQIPESYLKYEGEWIDSNSNLGDFLCLAELSRTKISSIDDSIYILNEDYNKYYYSKNKIKEVFNDYSRNLRPINEYRIPIYIISYTYAGFNEELLKEYMTSQEIYNYEIIIMDNFKKNKDKDFRLYRERNISERNIMSLNYIYNILKCFEKINKSTNYDQIYMLNSDLVFFNEFDIHLNKIDENTENKDFVFIGYEEFNNTSINPGKMIEITNYNTIEDKNLRNNFAFICSRKFREYILKYDLNYFYDNALSFIDMILLIKNKEFLKYETDLMIYSYNDKILNNNNKINNNVNNNQH